MGSAICAATVSELAVTIQAMPAIAIAGTASHSVGDSTTVTAIAACVSVPSTTNWSRPMRLRRRVIDSAATIAPAPIAASSSVKVPAPPPWMPRATSGSSAVSAVDCRKNRKMRIITLRMRGDCITCCRPTRIAPTKRSPGSALTRRCERQRRISPKATIDSPALSRNTKGLPAPASSAPATTGPITRDMFIATPLSASAAGRSWRGTTSGTIAANTGQRIAMPMPLAKVNASSTGALSNPASASVHSTTAMLATHSCVTAK